MVFGRSHLANNHEYVIHRNTCRTFRFFSPSRNIKAEKNSLAFRSFRDTINSLRICFDHSNGSVASLHTDGLVCCFVVRTREHLHSRCEEGESHANRCDWLLTTCLWVLFTNIQWFNVLWSRGGAIRKSAQLTAHDSMDRASRERQKSNVKQMRIEKQKTKNEL